MPPDEFTDTYSESYMLIAYDLLAIFERCVYSQTVAEMDDCISQYKATLGNISDETETIPKMVMLIDAKAYLAWLLAS